LKKNFLVSYLSDRNFISQSVQNLILNSFTLLSWLQDAKTLPLSGCPSSVLLCGFHDNCFTVAV
jgi:hypothetical protein